MPQLSLSLSIVILAISNAHSRITSLVLKEHSTRGLSFSAYFIEMIAYVIATVYCYRTQCPFSTYGESLLLSLQNIMIILYIMYYSRLRFMASSREDSVFYVGVAIAAGACLLYIIPLSLLETLQPLTVPVAVLSKIPQIIRNYRTSSTGLISGFVVRAQITSCFARMFTTPPVFEDTIVWNGSMASLVLNSVLGVQVLLYRKRGG